MIEICALASGSNGNCYYIGNQNEAVLIDLGISYKRLLERIKDAGLDKSKIKAVFISHEHTDHIQGIKTSCKKMGINGVFSKLTFSNLNKKCVPEFYAFFEASKPYVIGDLKIFPFRKSHDAIDPHSFRVEQNGFSVGVFTDIGLVDETFEGEFNKCQAVFLESNYDFNMLRSGPYPEYLKARVHSNKGHLSNSQALELVQEYAAADLKTILLSHISDKNNHPDKVLETFDSLKNKYDIKLTSRHGISEIVRFQY